MCMFIGGANGRDFKAAADASGSPDTAVCEGIMIRGIKEADAVECFGLFQTAYAASEWDASLNAGNAGCVDINGGTSPLGLGSIYLAINSTDRNGGSHQAGLQVIADRANGTADQLVTITNAANSHTTSGIMNSADTSAAPLFYQFSVAYPLSNPDFEFSVGDHIVIEFGA